MSCQPLDVEAHVLDLCSALQSQEELVHEREEPDLLPPVGGAEERHHGSQGTVIETYYKSKRQNKGFLQQGWFSDWVPQSTLVGSPRSQISSTILVLKRTL